jgi:2-oxoglutarate/2-oxoacid ferredoxin oxidoreductase subunit alpha
MDYSIKIGGEAGQGIQTIGETLSRVFSRSGYHVFSHQDYESRIRGGHNFYQIRISDKPVRASRDRIDILIALDRESIACHEKELNAGGRILFDSSSLKDVAGGPSYLDIPFSELALKSGGSAVMANTVATGAVIGMLGMDAAPLNDLIANAFRSKGSAVIDANMRAAQAGYEHASRTCTGCAFSVAAGSGRKLLMTGVDGIGLGALASGCGFYAAYPMTPSTGIMNYLAAKSAEYGVVVEQAEDEIAAINMALGASFAGARAMTGTSGGGFALMVEGLSLAGMTETPVVIAMGQRPGPATGFPTRTEQGDLQFLLSAGHGEFPRVLFAPGTPKQAALLTNKAFDLAERFQIPAFILFDAYLADTQWTFGGIDHRSFRFTDERLRGAAFQSLASYRRHAATPAGVSPLAVPGDARHVVGTDSDEHDEDGHIVEDAATREAMTDKRVFRKLPQIAAEIAPPFLYGDHDPETVIAGWGSSYGVMREAVDVLSRRRSIAMLHFSELFPFPGTASFDYLALLRQAKRSICIEQNATGQFSRLMRAETGFEFSDHIRKFNGRPFLAEELCELIHEKCKMKTARSRNR